MSWIRIEDKFCSHPKLMQGGALAITLQIRALCYAGQHLTDGLIPTGALMTMTADFCEMAFLAHPSNPEGMTNTASIEWGERMVELALWDPHPNGWVIHDYLKYNPSKKDQEALQRLRQREGRKAALKRWNQDRTTRSPRLPNGPEQDWLTTLKGNPLYAHVNFEQEMEQMQRWKLKPKNKNRQINETFVINWINKIDKPLSNGHAAVSLTCPTHPHLTFADAKDKATHDFLYHPKYVG